MTGLLKDFMGRQCAELSSIETTMRALKSALIVICKAKPANIVKW